MAHLAGANGRYFGGYVYIYALLEYSGRQWLFTITPVERIQLPPSFTLQGRLRSSEKCYRFLERDSASFTDTTHAAAGLFLRRLPSFACIAMRDDAYDAGRLYRSR